MPLARMIAREKYDDVTIRYTSRETNVHQLVFECDGGEGVGEEKEREKQCTRDHSTEGTRRTARTSPIRAAVYKLMLRCQ